MCTPSSYLFPHLSTTSPVPPVPPSAVSPVHPFTCLLICPSHLSHLSIYSPVSHSPVHPHLFPHLLPSILSPVSPVHLLSHSLTCPSLHLSFHLWPLSHLSIYLPVSSVTVPFIFSLSFYLSPTDQTIFSPVPHLPVSSPV